MTNTETIVFNELLESLEGMVSAMSSDLHDLMLAKLRAIEAIKVARHDPDCGRPRLDRRGRHPLCESCLADEEVAAKGLSDEPK